MLLASVLSTWAGAGSLVLLGSLFRARAGATGCVWATLPLPLWTLVAAS